MVRALGFLVGCGLTIAACGGGTGTVGNPPEPTREPPGTSTESPGAGRESPGAGESSGANCPKCAGLLSCTVTEQGQTTAVTLQLATQNGQCTLSEPGKPKSDDPVLSCDGTVVQKGVPVGSWSPTGGGFDFCDKKSGVCFPCVPAPQATPRP